MFFSIFTGTFALPLLGGNQNMTNIHTYAWIFLTISEQPTSLKDILWRADGINRADPTLAELRASFGWLQAQGLVEREGSNYRLTRTGAALSQSLSRPQNKLNIFEQWDAIAEKFALMPDSVVEPAELSEAELATAHRHR